MANESNTSGHSMLAKIGSDGPTFVAAALAVITALTGAIGGLTGGFARFMRNEQDTFYWGIGITAAAVSTSFIAAMISQSKSSTSRLLPNVLALVSFLSYVVAGGLVVSGLADSIQRGDSPRVTVTWKTIGPSQNLMATISVQLSGLKTSDVLYVTVDPGTVEGSAAQATAHLYQSVTGADPDGRADLTFDVPVPTGLSALQIVASVGKQVDCHGTPIESLQATPLVPPIPSPQASPALSSSPTPARVQVSFGPTPKYACVALIVPVPSASTAPKQSLSPSA